MGDPLRFPDQTPYKMMLNAMSAEEIRTLVDNKIIFTMTIFPASQVDMERNIDKGSIVICFDMHIFNHFTPREVAAMLLHEIGHALSPDLKGLPGELKGDSYAAERGYADAMASGLRKGVEKNTWIYC